MESNHNYHVRSVVYYSLYDSDINLVEMTWVEQVVPEAADLQSAGVTNFPTHPCMAALGGNDPHSSTVTVWRASVNTLKPYISTYLNTAAINLH